MTPLFAAEYTIVRHIDSGGQADVYELRHVAGGRYAGRVLREAWDPVQREEFRQCIARQLRAAGPGVVPVLAHNADAPSPFMVLEYMPHGSLADELLRRPDGLPLAEALGIAKELAGALADAHAKGLAHGDFKPGNVLKNAEGAWLLSDFGSAVTVGSQELLRAPRWVATPAYAAPEQLVGITMHVSDVYALGVVLHEMLTGSRTMTVLSMAGLVQRHGSGAAGLAELIARFTAKDTRLRPTAREAVTLLGEALRRATNLTLSERQIVRAQPRSTPVALSRAPSPPVRSDTPDWLKAIGWMGAAFVTAAAVNRSTKAWDPDVSRYRGSNGKFRGGGLFE